MTQEPVTLFVVLNGRHCKAYTRKGRRPRLAPIDESIPQSTFDPAVDHRSDHMGRTFDSHGAGRHAKEPATSLRETAVHGYATQIVDWMGKAGCVAEADSVVLVAPAAMLGELRKLMPKGLAARISEEINKDYTHLGVNDLAKLVLDDAA